MMEKQLALEVLAFVVLADLTARLEPFVTDALVAGANRKEIESVLTAARRQR